MTLPKLGMIAGRKHDSGMHMCMRVMKCGASEEPLLVLRRLKVDLVGRIIGSCTWLHIYTIMMIDYANAIREVPWKVI